MADEYPFEQEFNGMLNGSSGGSAAPDPYAGMPDTTPEQKSSAESESFFNTYQFPDRGAADIQPSFWGSFEKLFQSDRGAQMMLGGIAMGAKGILDWQSQRMAAQDKLDQINQVSANQQAAIDADIKRRSSRAKLRNSTKV